MKSKKKPFEVADQGKKKKPKTRRDGNSEKSPANQKGTQRGFFADPGVRETIESIVVAVILALLFRAYEAEAFVIPTGSMAPTLQGRHVDIHCDECGYNFRVGASRENPDNQPRIRRPDGKTEVDPDELWITAHATCPICRHTHTLDRTVNGWKSNEDSFYGDRIIVSKFAYDFSDPKRWDVIVFKYPSNPKQNYIKRLIGLPGETIKLEFGNVYVRNESGGFDIARKPHHKLKAMMQIVDDTDFVPQKLKDLQWPSRWNQWSESIDNRDWEIDSSGDDPVFRLTSTTKESWLRYRHVVPTTKDWRQDLVNDRLPERLKDFKGQLIADFYAYNYFIPNRLRQPLTVEDWMSPTNNIDGRYLSSKVGVHWVPDLIFESWVDIKSDTGELKLDLVKAGAHFTCSIDIKTGVAKISCDNQDIVFEESKESDGPSGVTPIRGAGSHHIRYANVDDKIYLWVNEKVVEFDSPTGYQNVQDRFPVPKYSDEDPADAEPIGIAAVNADIEISRLKILRDIYYINTRSSYDPNLGRYITANEYQDRQMSYDELSALEMRNIFENPETWKTDEVVNRFAQLIHETPNYFYPLEDDQFMPLGDNSPSSQDARAWQHGHFFSRKYLIGKAMFIYWPHAWRQPFFFPNFKRMGFIR